MYIWVSASADCSVCAPAPSSRRLSSASSSFQFNKYLERNVKK